MIDSNPYVIAEISANHKGQISNALLLIEHAALAGATAVKFQTFTADSITARGDEPLFVPSESQLWRGMDLWQLMDVAKTPREWFPVLFEKAKSLNLEVFSTPYDADGVDFLVDIGVKIMKVSSFDVVNLPFLEKVASTGLTTIMSTGMSKLDELERAVEVLLPQVPQLILLKCTSSYPCKSSDLNLHGIETLRDTFGCTVGFSDHSVGSAGAVVARALGAEVFEKHLKLEGDDEGLDAAFSIDGQEFREYVRAIHETDLILGSSAIEPVESEKASLWERPSLIAINHIDVGDVLTLDNVGIRRPSIGLPPSNLSRVLGQEARTRISKGTGILEGMF
jgi:sialic acid synthase SpsE